MARAKTNDADTTEEAADGEQAIEWDPESTIDGRGYTQSDFADELARHLPDQWEVIEFDIWGPEKLNHGGKGGFEATVEHVSGTAVSITPASTFPSRGRSRTVYNSHKVERERADGTSILVADEEEMVSRDRSGEVLGVVVAAAEDFQERWNLFH